MELLQIICCFAAIGFAHSWFYGRPEPNAWTRGGVWPLPWSQTTTNGTHKLDPGSFQFTSPLSPVPDILAQAFKRYKAWTFPEYFKNPQMSATTATLVGLKVTVNKTYQGEYPQPGMDESYTLVIKNGTGVTAELTANEVWGALRGLETFSQLVYLDDNNTYSSYGTTIMDHSRFLHRGILIDSSRHFLTVNLLKKNLELMAQNKMNVLHWHLVDSEAFPYTSAKYPNMSLLGAYTPSHRYSIADQKDIVDYARLNGIRVIPEFDTPGHMGSWNNGDPGLLSKAYEENNVTEKLSNIFDPSKEENFQFLQNFFNEARDLFKDEYMHFGGDEVKQSMIEGWSRNKNFTQWMIQTFNSTDVYKVLDYYFQRLFKIVGNYNVTSGSNMIVWQEVLDNNVHADKVIAHVWKGGNYEGIMKEMATVTANGHHAILSSCWYLNFLKYGADWGYVPSEDGNMEHRGMYYECDPQDFNGTQAQKDLVLGGEATLWGEFVDGTNLISRLWPRASAVAERLWSDPAQIKGEGSTAADRAWPRLHEHSCRMMRRGYRVQPINLPNYCPAFWDEDATNFEPAPVGSSSAPPTTASGTVNATTTPPTTAPGTVNATTTPPTTAPGTVTATAGAASLQHFRDSLFTALFGFLFLRNLVI